jgi:asparagine synthase (glutamine-hydrolysing)
MCGITGIILKHKSSPELPLIISKMSAAIDHRGPDGEGFLVGNGDNLKVFSGSVKTEKGSQPYIPSKNISEATGSFSLAFGHRRLSIIDLSVLAHQPFCSADEKIWITYNGEIYNYIELKKELIEKGHSFISTSDTEVIVAAYREWGMKCVGKFNGMWAFAIYDIEKGIVFASRDRFGVKPFYFVNDSERFAFASEQKVFVKGNLIVAEPTEKAVHEYLINGRSENERENFFKGVEELFPGSNLIYSLNDGTVKVEKYYSLEINEENNSLSDEELIKRIRERLFNSVKLRMRSDVEVGTCLSGGIDSSVLAVLMNEIGGKPVHCFTSVFKGNDISEEKFADVVANKIHAKYKKIEPTEEGFRKELDDLIYSQDVPIWDTSTYAQYKVMQLAKETGIKVVLDGQGADELFAGYHHHFVAQWNSLRDAGRPIDTFMNIKASEKSIKSPFIFYAKEKIKASNHISIRSLFKFYKSDFIRSNKVLNPVVYFDSVNEQLKNDIENARLKSFLKCEDRCGMWHGVESRTPFSDDIELIELMFSFNGNRKIQKGISKYYLREAMKDLLPKEITTRYDKRGFETPMLAWTKKLKIEMIEEVKGSNFSFVDPKSFGKINDDDLNEMKILFKLFVLSRWGKVQEGK